MKWPRQAVLPGAVLLVASLATITLVSVRPRVATRPPGKVIPLVEVIEVEPHPERVVVRAQGTVTPRTESELVAEVSGRIVWVAPGLANGGFVEPDEVLARIDPGDYEVAQERAEAALERADSQHAVAASNLSRVEKMARGGVASPSALDDAKNTERVARAAKRDAAAALEQARRDLERTRITSPFSGRVREKHVDVGQFVTRGAPVARVYAVDYAEVRLPLSDDDAAYLDLPIDYRGDDGAAEGPEARLHARFAGRTFTWTGRIVRTEGEIDPRTRMIHAVARVEDPYGRSDDPERPPLAVGLFVDAEIEGRLLPDAIAIPRSALRGRDQVVVVDAASQLRNRHIEVLRLEGDRVIVASGLEPGDRVCRTPMALSLDGTVVRVADVTNDEADAVAQLGSGR